MYTSKSYLGIIKQFETLAEVVRDIGPEVMSFRGFFAVTIIQSTGRYWCRGDSHIVYDELGLVVPVSKLKYTYENLPPIYWRSSLWKYYRDEHFRRLPVPYTRCYRGGGGWYRSPRTMNERRAAEALEVDDEMREYGIRPRRKGYSIPSAWDDILRNREINWKRQRRKQWR